MLSNVEVAAAKLRARPATPRPVMAGLSMNVVGQTGRIEAADEEALAGEKNMQATVDKEVALEKSAEDSVREGLLAIAELMALPTHATAEQQDHLVKVLEEEEEAAQARLAGLNDLSQAQPSYNSTKVLEGIRDPKVRARMEEMHKWMEESSRKNRLFNMNYLSKLKNAMRLVKKGALQGDEKAHKSLETVLERMGVTAHERAV